MAVKVVMYNLKNTYLGLQIGSGSGGEGGGEGGGVVNGGRYLWATV